MPKDKVIELLNSSIYQAQTLVLREVNLNVEKGEFVYLIGKTGTGKSSLLKTLYGDIPLRSGAGFTVGFDLSKLSSKEVPYLRRKIGIVFQDFQLLMDRSVFENLAFVLKATGVKDKHEIKIRIDTVLAKVGLKTKDFKMPHELSGGEQQRVVIARALLNEPELILADEPTGNLDPETSDDILNLIYKINQEIGTAVIIATHDYGMLDKYPGRILKCLDGRVVEDSEHIVFG